MVTASRLPLSTVHRGVAFEERARTLLREHLSMSLRRVGGKSDGGVDLQGWWWLPRSASRHEHGPDPACDDVYGGRRRIRVLAQCKAEKKKMGPNYVREMEGVLHRHLASREPHRSHEHGPDDTALGHGGEQAARHPLLAMLISESAFTKSTLLRALSSPIPMLLIHLPPLPDPDAHLIAEDEHEGGDPPLGELGAAFWNPALAGARGLLGGEIEVRWERELGHGRGRPGLWRDGERIRSWTPDDEGEEDAFDVEGPTPDQ